MQTEWSSDTYNEWKTCDFWKKWMKKKICKNMKKFWFWKLNEHWTLNNEWKKIWMNVKKWIPLPIFSTNCTSSLFNSHSSLAMGVFKIVPERDVTANPEWNWCIISSCTVLKPGPSNRKRPSGEVWTIKCLGELHITDNTAKEHQPLYGNCMQTSSQKTHWTT